MGVCRHAFSLRQAQAERVGWLRPNGSTGSGRTVGQAQAVQPDGIGSEQLDCLSLSGSTGSSRAVPLSPDRRAMHSKSAPRLPEAARLARSRG